MASTIDNRGQLHPETQDPRWPPFTPIRTALARRALLCLAPVETAAPDPLEVLRHQFPGVCAARLHYAAG